MAALSDSPNPKPKRFYQTAFVQAEPSADAPHWSVRLDGRLAKTPLGRPLAVASAALAEHMAAEWAAQVEVIDFARMPLTRWAYTTLDRTEDADAAMVRAVVGYAETDLLCYRADSPAELVAAEAEGWDPILAWAYETLSLEFVPTVGILHRVQADVTLARVADLARAFDPYRRTALTFAAGLYGSAVLALGVLHGRLSGEAAFDLSRLDDAFQEARWRVDDEAARRTARLRQEACDLELWLSLL